MLYVMITIVNLMFFTITMATRIVDTVTKQNSEIEKQELTKEYNNCKEQLYPPDKLYPFPIVEGDIRITSQFGIRTSPINHLISDHKGIDIYSFAPEARIESIADGVVIDSWPPPGGGYKGHPIYGGMVRIKHDDGSEALYAHLSDKFVVQDARVKKGQEIGREGSTGKTTGEHLHFELRMNGKLLNPYLWVTIPPTEELK